MKKVYLFILTILSISFVHAQDQCKVVGWGTQNGGVTGGGTATPTVVSTYAALKTALTTASVKVVHVSGTITFPTNGRITMQDINGKTVIGLPGSKMVSVDMTSSGSGILYVKRTTNLILRNLTFEGPGAYDEDGNDNLTFDDVQNAWVDHCDFQDGMDGNFDLKNMSDYISVTWCKFSYNKPPKAGGSGGSNDHRYTNLIGSSDGATGDAGKLRITFQYCWWGQGCVERMPRVRFGKIHLVNNYFNSTVSNSCIRAGYKADLLIESNVFVGVKKPIDLYNNDFTAVTARDNTFTNTSGGTTGSGTAFTPPYTLTIAPTNTVQSLITNTSCGSGATLDSPTQCGCGTPLNTAPTVTITAPSSGATGCVGTAITITANASDDVSVSKVDFYNGTTLLGTDNSSPYSFSYSPTAAGTLTLKAIATDGPGLTGTSANVTVTVSALPTPTITSPSASFCSGGNVVLTSSSASSYKWFNGTTQVGTASTYTATAAGSYTVEVTNAGGCKATSAAKVITVNALPTATITSLTTSFCPGGSVVLTSSAGTSYIWKNGSTQVGTAATYTATAAGSYTVEVTNANSCKATSAATTITVNALPTATITTPTNSICSGASVVLTASTGTSYKWFNGTNQVGTASTYTASTAGAYTVEVTNAAGCKATSAVTQIGVSTLPTATITTATTSFCTGSSILLTSSAGTSYKWFNGTNQVGTASTYTATTAGSYTVEVTNAGGCKATSAATQLTTTAGPTATITTPSTSFCDGSSTVLTSSTGTSYKWFNGTNQVGTTSTYTANTAGSYTVEVTNAAGCKTTSAATVVTIKALPTATISAPAASFCTGSSVLLTASTGASYKWFNGTTQVGTASTYTASTAGSYTVEVTNATDCKATSAITVITEATAGSATISAPSNVICAGSSVVLTASAGTSYKWFNGTAQVGTASTYTATAAGAYTVEVTNAGGCKSTSAVKQISVITTPTATITAPSVSICEGSSVVLTANAGTSYKWFNGTTPVGTDATFTATTAGTYTVEVTNAGGCKATSSGKTLTTLPNPVATITTSAKAVCEGSSIVLTASAGMTYKWFNGTTQVGTDATYTATTAGSYTVEVTNNSSCKATSAPTNIVVNPAPTATISGPSSICNNTSITLTASTAMSYKWLNGTTQVGTNHNYTTSTPGDYSVEVTNDFGCKATSATKTITTSQPSIWYEDTDGDGFGNANVSVTVCWQPTNYVTVAGDACPTDANKTTPGICGCNVVENTCTPTATINGSFANITVTPQPFDESTKVELVNYGMIKSIMVVSTSGAIVETQNNINAEAVQIGESLASGLYSVIIQTEKGVYTTKIVKK